MTLSLKCTTTVPHCLVMLIVILLNVAALGSKWIGTFYCHPKYSLIWIMIAWRVLECCNIQHKNTNRNDTQFKMHYHFTSLCGYANCHSAQCCGSRQQECSGLVHFNCHPKYSLICIMIAWRVLECCAIQHKNTNCNDTQFKMHCHCTSQCSYANFHSAQCCSAMQQECSGLVHLIVTQNTV